jgi:hypothetical protein
MAALTDHMGLTRIAERRYRMDDRLYPAFVDQAGKRG